MHADWTLLPRGRLFKRPEIELASSFLKFSLETLALDLIDAEIELASSLCKLRRDTLALLLMLLAVLVLTLLVAIPDALAPVALLEGITYLAARRAEFLGQGRGLFGPLFLCVSSHRFAERHGAELLSTCPCSCRCSFFFRWCHRGCPLFQSRRSSPIGFAFNNFVYTPLFHCGEQHRTLQLYVAINIEHYPIV